MAVLGLLLFNNLIYYYSGHTQGPQLSDSFFWDPLMLWGPMTYFFVRSMFDEDFKISKKQLPHFYPAILDLLKPIIGLTLWTLQSHPIYFLHEQTWIYYLDLYDTLIVIPGFISISCYLVLSWRHLAINRSIADNKTYRRSLEVLIAMSLLVLNWLPFLLLYISPFRHRLLETVYFYPIFYPLVIFIYYISIKSISNLSFRPNYLPVEELEQKAELLRTTIIEGNLYLDDKFNIQKLSEQTGLSQSTISFILNHYFSKGFNQFVNEIRIEEALRRIKESDNSKQTIEGIGYSVGFTSRSTFYRAFKLVTGKQPNAYLKLNSSQI